jgi:hypothetical protein
LPDNQRRRRDRFDQVRGDQRERRKSQPAGLVDDYLKPAYRVVRRFARSVQNAGVPVMYPPSGCEAITRRLAGLALEAGVEIRMSTLVSEVELQRDTASVSLSLNETPVTAGRVLLAAGTRLPGVRDGARRLGVAAEALTYQNLFLVLSGCGDLDFSYALICGDDLLQRASDLTRSAVAGPGSEQARLVAVSVDPRRSESVQVALECVARLKQYELVPPEAAIVSHAFRPYHFSWLSQTGRHQLRRDLHPLVDVIDSEWMTRSIKMLLRRQDVRPLRRFVQTGRRDANVSARPSISSS